MFSDLETRALFIVDDLSHPFKIFVWIALILATKYDTKMGIPSLT